MENCFRLYLVPVLFTRNTHFKTDNTEYTKEIERKVKNVIEILYPEFRELINTIEIDWNRKIVKINGKAEFMLLLVKDCEIKS